MKKESVNTFNEGLNYDLNPLVTPNNLLTDVVNGTFLTFNGNELSLQNDAGNIAITIKNSNDNIPTWDPDKLDYKIGDLVAITDNKNRLRYYKCLLDNTTEIPTDDNINWQEYIVRLSPGFVPIGIKEFGGVLYIVSRKQVGNEPNPNVDQIEFGSFPSPENYTQSSGKAKETVIELIDTDQDTSVDTPNILNNPISINDIIFRPGEYTKFVTSGVQNIEYLSRKNDIRFYRLKLLQQLTSGYLDLTNDVESKYEKFLSENPTHVPKEHWVLDSDFIYPCPFLYKGNLSLKLELEPLIDFRLIEGPSLNYSIGEESNTFVIELSTLLSFNSGQYSIKGKGIKVETFIEDVETGDIQIETLNSDVDFYENKATIEIPGEYSNKILYYKISPDYDWLGYSEGDDQYLPEEYKNNYLIEGKLILSDTYFNVSFSLDQSLIYSPQNTCSSVNVGYRVYNEIVLVNGSNQLLDYNLEVTNTPHVLISTGINRPHTGNVLLGTYTINSDKSITISSWATTNSVTSEPITIPDSTKQIINLAISNFVAEVEDDSCNTVPLNIIVEGEADIRIKIKQTLIINGQPQEFTYYETWGNSASYNVVPNIPVNLEIAAFDTIEYDPIVKEESKNYLKITDTIINPTRTYLYGLVGVFRKINDYAVWNEAIDLDTTTPVEVEYFSIGTSAVSYKTGTLIYTSLLKNVFSESGSSPFIFTNSVIRKLKFLDNNITLQASYDNIPNPENYVLINGVRFNKETIVAESLDML